MPEPSELAKVFLRQEEAKTDTGHYDLPPRPVRIRHAEAAAREWAKHWFSAQQAEKWITTNGGNSATVAASLRDADSLRKTPQCRSAPRAGSCTSSPLAIRVSSGEPTLAEAAAELQEMRART